MTAQFPSHPNTLRKSHTDDDNSMPILWVGFKLVGQNYHGILWSLHSLKDCLQIQAIEPKAKEKIFLPDIYLISRKKEKTHLLQYPL